MKNAFTLPEVLVAVLIFAIGVLGLASSGSFIALQAGEARAMTEGALLAGRALDSLRSISCAAVSSGQLVMPTTTMRWTATPSPRSLAINATLELTFRRGSRRWHLNTLLPCEP